MGFEENLSKFSKKNKKHGQTAITVGQPIVGVICNLGLGIPSLIVGAVEHDSDCDVPLANWLMVTGSVSIFQAMIQLCILPFGLLATLRGPRNVPVAVQHIQAFLSIISLTVAVFWFGWFVLGGCWLWGYDNYGSACPQDVKSLMAVNLIIYYIITGALVLLVIGVTAVMCFFGLIEVGKLIIEKVRTIGKKKEVKQETEMTGLNVEPESDEDEDDRPLKASASKSTTTTTSKTETTSKPETTVKVSTSKSASTTSSKPTEKSSSGSGKTHKKIVKKESSSENEEAPSEQETQAITDSESDSSSS